MNNFLNLACTQCGAAQSFGVEEVSAKCEFCGHVVPIYSASVIRELSIPVVAVENRIKAGRIAELRKSQKVPEGVVPEMVWSPFWFCRGRVEVHLSGAVKEVGLDGTTLARVTIQETQTDLGFLIPAADFIEPKERKVEILESWEIVDFEESGVQYAPSSSFQERLPEFKAKATESMRFRPKFRVHECFDFNATFHDLLPSLMYRPLYIFRYREVARDYKLVLDGHSGEVLSKSYVQAPPENVTQKLDFIVDPVSKSPLALTEKNKEACRSCGSPIDCPKEGELTVCTHCGSSYYLRAGLLEEVADHRILPLEVNLAKARETAETSLPPNLVYLPFWVIKGTFRTNYTLASFQESLWRLTRTFRQGHMDQKAVLSVPACATETCLGAAISVAVDSECADHFVLKEGRPKAFSSEVLSQGRWFSGTKPQDASRQAAIHSIENLHRNTIEFEHENVSSLQHDSPSIQECYLVHRPFWVFSGETKSVVVDGHTGGTISRSSPKFLNKSVSSKSPRQYSNSRIRNGLIGAFASVVPAVLAAVVGGGWMMLLLILAALLLFFSTRLFTLGVFSPYRTLREFPERKTRGILHFDLSAEAPYDSEYVMRNLSFWYFIPFVFIPIWGIALGGDGFTSVASGGTFFLVLLLEASPFLLFGFAVACLHHFAKSFKAISVESDNPHRARSLSELNVDDAQSGFTIASRLGVIALFALAMFSFSLVVLLETILVPVFGL